mmetsp:Transcript_37894/g.105447  ORF Transcript_37894/g.105447 Transcript_37894/m.105447 type:complete len:204 (-) Transcript_37894:1426-2037(-)
MQAFRLLLQVLSHEVVLLLAIEVCKVVVPGVHLLALVARDFPQRRSGQHHLQARKGFKLLVLVLWLVALVFPLLGLLLLLFGLRPVEVLGFHQVAVPVAREAVQVHQRGLVRAHRLHDLHLCTEVHPALLQACTEAALSMLVALGSGPSLEEPAAAGLLHAGELPLRELGVPLPGEALSPHLVVHGQGPRADEAKVLAVIPEV